MNKDKYLIAIDLDGTLLTDDKKITPKTRNYLNALHDEGHLIVIATGRPFRAAYGFQQQLGVNGPLVTYNGSLTSNPHDASFLTRTRKFDRFALKDMVDAIGFDALDNLMIETEHVIYLLHEDEALNNFFWNDRERIIYGNPFLHLNEDPLALIFLFKNTDPEYKKEVSRIVESFPDLHIRFWNLEGYAELWIGESTKKDGLEHIANFYNFPQKRIIAFGDAYNDKEMLAWANYGVWMKNGVPSVEAYANMKTTEDNNNDGIVSTLQKIIK
ncbi:MAG: Cof-type HAD-IIB family hydrolase [Bacilli bacterium]|jgi:Cof subfamily protein (haloacid dehalogenase superfamily)|nr:Cof-type HAD-IIB family hydrolase [Bacillota bacterium]